MRKFLVACSLLAIIATSSNAQSILAGGGLVYGTWTEQAGINIRGDFRLYEVWCIIPGINFYFAEKYDNYKFVYRDYFIDGHYLFGLNDQVNVYPLAGINISTFAIKDEILGDDSDAEVGLNIGGGIEYFFTEKVAGFFEIKYTIAKTDQAIFGLGAVYKIK